MESQDDLTSLGLGAAEGDDRTLVDLLIDQVEFANVILLIKTDVVKPEQLRLVEAIIRKLNPEARLVHTCFSKLPAKELLNTKLFDFERASQSAGWLRELSGKHTPETEEYGISSFVYRRDRPFHPERFSECIKGEWPGVVRSKRFFWLASRPRLAGSWSQAGGSCRTEPAGFWAAATDDGTVVSSQAAPIRGKQEIVLIGVRMNQKALTAMLDACLLTEAEFASRERAWQSYRDPFYPWNIERAQ